MWKTTTMETMMESILGVTNSMGINGDTTKVIQVLRLE